MTVVSVVSVAAAGAVDAQVPRGRRPHRATPTDVIVVESECRVASAGAPLTLRAGVAVTRVKQRSKGVVVALDGAVSVTCTVAPHSLGKRLMRDVQLPEGGAAFAGALVRVLPAKAPRGMTRVESTGPVVAQFDVPSDALAATPQPFLYREPPARHWVAPFAETRVYAKQASVGTNAPVVATLAPETDAVLLEQAGPLARVRSHGPIEVEGWALNKQFADRRAQSEQAELLKPSHEVFVGAALYPEVDAKIPVAQLRGGTLVELNKLHGGRVKITTTGAVIASGFVEASALRPLSSLVE